MLPSLSKLGNEKENVITQNSKDITICQLLFEKTLEKQRRLTALYILVFMWESGQNYITLYIWSKKELCGHLYDF